MDEYENNFNCWIYTPKHMDILNKMPFKARKAISERLEKWASQALTPEERAQYEEEWKIYNDYFNTLDFAEQKGFQKGRQEAFQQGYHETLIEIARKFKEMGLTTEMIIQGTGLSKEDIEKL